MSVRATSGAFGMAVVAVAGVVVGVAAEATAFDAREVSGWLDDLIVGLCLIAAGLVAARRLRATGALLVVTGFGWFAGNFWPWALYLHRGPLIHALVAFPGWRPLRRVDGALLLCGYAVALITPIWRSDVSSLVVGSAMLVVVTGVVAVISPRHRDVVVGHVALAVLLVTLAGGAALRLAAPDGQAFEPTLLVYEVVLCALAVRLAWDARPPVAATVADLVVELGEAPSGSLRDQLALTLRDPSLQVGFSSGDRGFVDDLGRLVPMPAAGDRRAATVVEWESQPYAVIVHDQSVLGDPALVDAVTTATRLSAVNAALQVAVRSQVDELVESRRRVVSAADVERRRLERRLRDGPGRRLRRLWVQVEVAQPDAGEASRQHLQRADSHLTHALIELDRIAQGLHPGELTEGLRSALSAQAERSPMPVAVWVTDERFAVEVEAAVYYMCAECLANVAKHAHATRSAIEVCRRGQVLVVVVDDDGIGGADVRGGTGLRGVVDRIEAIGGKVRVYSPTGDGTRLVAELPLGHPST